MKLLELGLPELTEEQIEEVCAVADAAARKFILSKVSQKLVDKLDISVEAEGANPVSLTIEVDLLLSLEAEKFDQKALADQAVKEAFKASEDCLRKLRENKNELQ